MSDTSTLIAIKYKGQMIELPKDSSVSWNDLEDKPTVKEFIGYDVYENNINPDFPAATITCTDNSRMLDVYIRRNRMEFYVNPGSTYYNGTYTDKHGNTQTLSDWLKLFISIVCYKDGVYRTKMIIQPKSDHTHEMILFESLDVEISSIEVHNYSDPTSGGGKYNLIITFTFNSQDYNYSVILQEITDGYWQVVATDKVYSEKFLPTVIDTSNLVSKSELYDLSIGIVNNYYTKTQIDTSIANNYASKNDISAFITSNDVSIYLTDNDISTFITANDISTFITANDVSIYLTDNDISTFITTNDISTKLEANDVSLFASKSDVSALDTSVSQLWDTSTSGGSVDTSNFVTKTELYDIETTTEGDYAKGNTMMVGKNNDFAKSFQKDSQTNKVYFLFDNLTEQEDIWNYSLYGDYCYMNIIKDYNSSNVYGWFVLYKNGTVVKTSENLSADKISLEYRTSGSPVGLLIFVDDSNIINGDFWTYMVYFYQCTYTPGETTTTYTIKESLLPNISGGGGGISLQYLTQAEYDALQTKDPNTLYLIEESV